MRINKCVNLGQRQRGPREPRFFSGRLVATLILASFFAIAVLVFILPAEASDRVVKVGVEDSFPPYVITGSDGKPSGFSVELLKVVAKNVNLKLDIEASDWDTVRKQLEAGKIDLTPVMARSSNRAAIVDFCDVHTIGYDAIFIRKGETRIHKAADLEGKTLIVELGDLTFDKLEERSLAVLQKTGHKPFTLVTANTIDKLFEMLLKGEGDAIVGAQIPTLLALRKFPTDQIVLADQPMLADYSRDYSFGVRKGETELVSLLNQGLKTAIATGQYNKIYEKWFSNLDPEVREKEERAELVRRLIIGFTIAVLVALIALAMVVVFRREVNRKAYSLAESELRLKNVVVDLPGAVFSCAIALNHSRSESPEDLGLTLTYISEFVEKLTGYKAETFVGGSLEIFARLVHPDDFESVKTQLAETLLKRKRTEIEFRIYHRDGTVKWIQGRLSAPSGPIDERNLIATGILFDVTETRRISDLLSQQQSKMAASARLSALGEMAGGIAHEINNPLAIINLRTHQLSQLAKKGPISPEDAGIVASGIEATAQRISKIVRSLQKVSRESEGDPFDIVPLKEILDETLELCYQRMLNNGINVKLPQIPSPGLSIECRRVQISQVLINILNNAFDAVLPLSDRFVQLEARDLGDRVELSIANSGPKIPPELEHKIFQPFFTTKGVGKGTGLGLSISKGLIESNNGEISLDFASAQTRFVITLPKKQTKPVPGASESSVNTNKSTSGTTHPNQ